MLTAPTETVRASFVAAVAEGGGPIDHNVGDQLEAYSAHWSTPEGFHHYVRLLREQAREDAPRPAGHVPYTALWWIRGPEHVAPEHGAPEHGAPEHGAP